MRCGYHVDERYLAHATPDGHPERPERIEALLAVAGVPGVGVLDSSRRASDTELVRVHSRSHLERIEATAGRPRVMLDPDTFTVAASADTARFAAGAVLEAVDAVVAGRLDRALCAVRPPGHHAERDRAMGFCLFNNVAVAAAHLRHHGLERVLVVDWDVHHGNGTQEIFYDDSSVLFVSLHQYPFYPGTGSLQESGEGDGSGRTVNVPLPAGCGDGDYLAAFRRVVVPVARAFRPQAVLISAGFDAHVDDPLGGMRVTDAGFAAMTQELCGLADECCDGRLVGVLEGGYDTAALRRCVEAVLATMAGAGQAPVVAAGTERSESAIAAAVAAAREHWRPGG